MQKRWKEDQRVNTHRGTVEVTLQGVNEQAGTHGPSQRRQDAERWRQNPSGVGEQEEPGEKSQKSEPRRGQSTPRQSQWKQAGAQGGAPVSRISLTRVLRHYDHAFPCIKGAILLKSGDDLSVKLLLRLAGCQDQSVVLPL